MNLTERKIGTVLILVDKNSPSISILNSLLSSFGRHILSRQGLSFKDRPYNLITIVFEADIDSINSFAGKIGRLAGIKVKLLVVKP